MASHSLSSPHSRRPSAGGRGDGQRAAGARNWPQASGLREVPAMLSAWGLRRARDGPHRAAEWPAWKGHGHRRERRIARGLRRGVSRAAYRAQTWQSLGYGHRCERRARRERSWEAVAPSALRASIRTRAATTTDGGQAGAGPRPSLYQTPRSSSHAPGLRGPRRSEAAALATGRVGAAGWPRLRTWTGHGHQARANQESSGVHHCGG